MLVINSNADVVSEPWRSVSHKRSAEAIARTPAFSRPQRRRLLGLSSRIDWQGFCPRVNQIMWWRRRELDQTAVL